MLGDLPANAYATRINREADNPQIEAIRFAHNVFADNTSTMVDFSDTLPADLSTARPSVLVRNAYWNGGAPNSLPNDPTDVLNITGDATRVTTNPLLPATTNVTTPHWIPAMSQFNGGQTTIAGVFTQLATTYGTPAAGSALIDAATPGADVPAVDLLGNPRPAGSADLGAVEVQVSGVVFANGFE